MSLSRINRLSIKLPAFVALAIAIVVTGLSVFTYFSSKYSTLERLDAQLSVVLEKKQATLQSWYQNIDVMLSSLAANPTSIQAAVTLDAMWNIMDDASRLQVQQDFTVLNPLPLAERRDLVVANEQRGYDKLHAQHHEYFDRFVDVNELYDLFIVNPEGDVIYSVLKENDFAQSVVSGPLANSGLGKTFKGAMENTTDRLFLSGFEAYSISNGAIASFAGVRIENSEKLVKGVLIIQLNQDRFASLINDTVGMAETGETYVVDADGLLLSDSRFEEGPRALDQTELSDKIISALAGKSTDLTNATGIGGNPVKAKAAPLVLGNRTYGMVTEMSENEIFADLRDQRNALLQISALLAGVLILSAWFYINRITSALKQLGHEMTEVSDGHFDKEVSGTARRDEIGEIAHVLVDFREKLMTAAQLQEERDVAREQQNRTLEILRSGLVQLAEGDLSQPIDMEFSAEYESLRADFNRTLSSLSEAISSVMSASESIQHGAQEISQASDDLSNRTENQAATLEQTAAALDELTASVKSAAEGAKSVESIIHEAQSEAEASGKIVSDAIAAMTQIEDSSKHISQIISVIDDIAFQTNLLVLNAGVEAARAGDAGKGFAVVASEVRALAQRSSEAAKEIKTLISGSAKEVGRGVELVGGAGDALTNIVKRVSHISELVRTMATGTSEQAIGLGEINIGVNQLDQVTQQNAAMVEESTAASHVLKADAIRLREMVKRFRTGDEFEAHNGTPQRAGSATENVSHVKFTPSSEVKFTPMQSDMTTQNKKTGTTNAPSAGNEWIDF